MSIGRKRARQRAMFVATTEQAGAPRHRFYQSLDEFLRKAKFDAYADQLCAPFYEEDGTAGRPSIPPGVYFRMLLVGFFEGIESERGICWRCSDSLSLKEFLGFEPHEETLRFDRKRKGKRASNKEWMSPVDPDAKIMKLKDGRTRLSYKAKHVMDMETGAILAAELLPSTTGDATSLPGSLDDAKANIERTFAHLCETGAHRRVRLRGRINANKRYLLHAAAANLALVMRDAFGFGTPRAWSDAAAALAGLFHAIAAVLRSLKVAPIRIFGALTARIRFSPSRQERPAAAPMAA